MLQGFSANDLLVMAGMWAGLVTTLVLFAVSRMWRSNRKTWRLLAKAFIALWMTAFLACSLETCFALFYDTTDSFGLVKTSKRWYERHVHLNNMGFRDRKDFSLRPRPGTIRILLAGDSFAFGHGIADVGDRFGDILEHKCEAVSKGRCELYNMSEPGQTTRLLLESLSQRFQSGLSANIVVYVYNLNDVEDLSEDSRYIIGTIILDTPQNWILRQFYLPNFLYYRFSQFSRPEVTNYFHWLDDAYTGELWKQQTAQFAKLKSLCDKHDVKLLVVMFPFMHNLSNYNFTQVHEKVGEYWEERGVPVLDLLPVMQQHQSEDLVVNRYDAHPNERANAIAAEAIWEQLLKQQLLNELKAEAP